MAKRRWQRDLVRNYLRYHACVDCGSTWDLTFDHVRGQKIDNVTTLAVRGAPFEEVLNEIKKCEIRCWPCHQKRHRQEVG